MSLRVLKPGLLSTVQDAGRCGWMAAGVGRAGPLDPVAWRLANALVGNDAGAAGLELTIIGPQLRFERATTIAITGAEFPLRLDGAPLSAWRPQSIAAGQVLDCGTARRGARAWLAIAGGIDLPPVLGSRATDVNTGLGPLGGRPLRAGDVLPLVAAPRVHAAGWSLDPRPWFDPDPGRPLRLIPGTHFEALDRSSREALFGASFRVAADSNRVGFRLDGPQLALAAPVEMVSEAVAFGTLQLPPGGQPIALMAEHPTTGGYPRIAQVAAIDLPRLAQRRPGESLRFEPATLTEAEARLAARERALGALLDSIRERLGNGLQALASPPQSAR